MAMFLRLARQKMLVAALASIYFVAFVTTLPPAALATEAGAGDDGNMEWSDTVFTESSDNDGSIGNAIGITLVCTGPKSYFADSEDLVADGAVTVQNVPAGLTCRVLVTDDTHCTVLLDGKANQHDRADSISNMQIIFNDEAFKSLLVSSKPLDFGHRSRDDLHVNFEDNIHTVTDVPIDVAIGALNWSTAGFTEADPNDGSIADTITVTLTAVDDTLEGFVLSDDLVAEGLAEVHNLPPGLTCVMETSVPTSCTIRLEGQATHHDIADSIDDLSIEFLDGAFSNGNAAVIADNARDDLVVSFIEEGVPGPVPGTDIVATFMVGETSYFVNGVLNHMDVAPFAESNRAFVPVRYLAYCMGMTEDNVDWDGNYQTATITEGEVTVILQIGNKSMNANGDPQLMDVAPQARSNRIFLPARFVVEAFGGSVEWNGDTQTVTVNRNI